MASAVVLRDDFDGARLKGAGRSQQHHPAAAAAQMPRAQPGRERLAVHARQLAVEPRLQILRRYPRSLLLRLEPPHRSAMAHNVARPPNMGSSVLIRESWYETQVHTCMQCGHPIARHDFTIRMYDRPHLPSDRSPASIRDRGFQADVPANRWPRLSWLAHNVLTAWLFNLTDTECGQ